MSKKFVLLLLLLALALVACGGLDSGRTEPEAPEQSPAETEEAVATEAPTTELPPTEMPPTEEAPPEEPTAVEATEAPTGQESMEAQTDHVLDPRLVNITWEWVRRDPNGNASPEITVPNPETYILFFNEDDSFNVTLDCNTGSGVYITPAAGEIFMELGQTTRAACGPESLADDMVKIFGGAVQNYHFEDDNQTLVLAWVAGGPLDYYRNAESPRAGEEVVGSIPEDAIQLDLNGLATSYDWQVMPGSPIPEGPGGQGFPPHILITFDGTSPEDAVQDQLQRIYIFPTEAYVNLYQAGGRQDVADQVVRLGQLISTADSRTELPKSPMPLLPPPNSFMDRWFQFLDLDFGVGRGVRYVSDSPFRQSIGVWTNNTTGYFYQGLSNDQTFYVSMFWPVSTEELPNTVEEASEEQKTAAENPDTYQTYTQELKDALNALPASAWSPDLSSLDAMAASLTFPLPGDTEGEAAGEGQTTEGEEVELPEPGVDGPTATVTAPDGIYLRSGPGTEYPDIGVAAFEDTGNIIGISEDGQWWVIEVPVSVAEDGQGWVSAAWVETSNAAGVPVVPTPDLEAVQPSLTGVNWQWISLTTPVETTSVNDPTRYMILFNEDGTAAIQADCNNVGASYMADGSDISITMGAATSAYCGEESLDQPYLDSLGNAAIYFFQDGDLFLDLAADGGTMRFTAGDAQAPVAPEPTLEPGSPTSPAQGILFNLVSFGPEGAEQTLIEGSQITVTFSDQSVSGNAGCNDYTGLVTPVDDFFTISGIAKTQNVCATPEGVMEQEQAYLAALEGTAGYQWQQGVAAGNVITGGRLFYRLADGTTGFLNFVTP